MDNLSFTKLVEEVAEETGYPVTTVRIILKSALWRMLGGLSEGKRVRLPGFGSFTPGIASPRRMRNPATGEMAVLPARGKVQFRAGKRMREFSEAALTAMLDCGTDHEHEALVVIVADEQDEGRPLNGEAVLDEETGPLGGAMFG